MSAIRPLQSIRSLSVAGIAALASFVMPVAAQNYPTRSITLVVPFGPGSATDVVARIIGARMSEALGQQVIVENISGAGGMIGLARVAKAPPDGYMMGLGAVDSIAQSQALFATPLYNSATDFTPVGLAVEQPLLLIARKELPASTLKEFAAYVKANHGKMQFGSGGAGSAVHLACSQITQAIGTTVAHVPYRSSAAALQDLVAGTLDFYCPLAAAGAPLIDSKSVKALAILTRDRSPLMPNLPSAREQGIDGIDAYYWMGYFLPKSTPDPIVDKLNAAMRTALDTPAVIARLKDVGTTVVPADRRSPSFFKSFVSSEISKWSEAIKTSGVKLN